MNSLLPASAVGALLWLLSTPLSAAVRADQVLVVVNDSSPISQAIGTYYASVRDIPAHNVCHLPVGTPTTELVYRNIYNSKLRDPIRTYLSETRPHLRDQIRFIVLTKGIPHGIVPSGGSGSWTTGASVDSELTQLFTDNVAIQGQPGWIDNPYYDMPMGIDQFEHPDLSYLVFRLDGYQTNVDPNTGVPADIKRLIDDAQSPAQGGKFLFDTKWDWLQEDMWMIEAALTLDDMGANTVLNTIPQNSVKNVPNLLGYCSWGSNDNTNPGPPFYGEVPAESGQHYPGFFKRGAIATTYVSTSARTFLVGSGWYGQSLIADLIHLGVAAANGHVFEPYTAAVAKPQILFPRYLEGFTVGEAYYQSIALLSWQNVIVCDPLMMSGVVRQGPTPSLTDISPFYGPYQGGQEVTLHGDSFRVGDGSSVLIGDSASSDVTMVKEDELRVRIPPGEPGLSRVKIVTENGTVSRPGGYIYTPAILVAGGKTVGAHIDITLYGESGQGFVVLSSLGRSELAFGDLGTLKLDPTRSLVRLFGGSLAADRKDISGAIPNDPGFSGLTLYLQAVVGEDIGRGRGQFTNCVTLTID